jgi:GAF domain-containing protein
MLDAAGTAGVREAERARPRDPGMAIDPAELARALGGLVPSGDTPPDPVPSLQRAVGATREVFRVTGAGLMLVDEENVLRSAVASDASARKLELAQETLAEGPSVDAFLIGRMVETADIVRDDRWPRLTPVAAEQGVAAALGIPTRLNGELIGSLDVFVDEPHDWDESERRALEAFNRLRQSARSAGRKVGDVARELLAGEGAPGPGGRP